MPKLIGGQIYQVLSGSFVIPISSGFLSCPSRHLSWSFWLLMTHSTQSKLELSQQTAKLTGLAKNSSNFRPKCTWRLRNWSSPVRHSISVLIKSKQFELIGFLQLCNPSVSYLPLFWSVDFGYAANDIPRELNALIRRSRLKKHKRCNYCICLLPIPSWPMIDVLQLETYSHWFELFFGYHVTSTTKLCHEILEFLRCPILN